MSTTERAAREVKSLRIEEWKSLAGLERAAGTTAAPDISLLSRLADLPRDRVAFAVEQLQRKGLAGRRGASLVLMKEGVEVLALREYARKDLVYALGAIIAKGKESDVYEAVNEEGGLYALKFFKLGRTSFTQVRKKRFREPDVRSWMNVNYEAARREYTSLKRLHRLGRGFPEAIAYDRNTVLLQHLSGVRLSGRPPLDQPREVLTRILEFVRKAYLVGKLVNADLSEYNILTDGADVWLIDWPQAVEADHPNASTFLTHDVVSVVRFFRRAYRIEMDEEKCMSFVTGKSSALE